MAKLDAANSEPNAETAEPIVEIPVQEPSHSQARSPFSVSQQAAPADLQPYDQPEQRCSPEQNEEPTPFSKTSTPPVEHAPSRSATSQRRRSRVSRRAVSLSGIEDDELADEFVETRLSRNFSAWRESSMHYLSKVPKKLADKVVVVGPSVKDAVTAAVSPRLAGRIRHAFMLACIILTFTIGAVIGLVYALRSQCFSNCQNAPISDIVSLVDPVCKPFSSQTFAPSLSSSTKFDPFAQNLAAFVPTEVSEWLKMQGFFDYVPAPIGWFSKCAIYSETCSAVEKALWLYGLVTLRNKVYSPQENLPPNPPSPPDVPPNPAPPPAKAGGSRRLRQAASPPAASPAAPSPSPSADSVLSNQSGIETIWADGKVLPNSLNFAAAYSGGMNAFGNASFIQNAQINQEPRYFTNATLNATLFFNSSFVIKTIKAPAGAACCDVTLERDAVSMTRFAMTIQSSNSPDWPKDSCPSPDGRCASTAIVIITDFSCWDNASALTSDYADGSPCAGRSELNFRVFFNQFIGPLEAWAVPPNPDSEVAVILSTSASFNSSQHSEGWAANGLDIPSIYDSDGGIEVAAWAALFPMAYSAGIAFGTFMVAGMMTADMMKESELTSWFPNGDGWVIGWWNQVTIYCCSDQCPSALSAIGGALGYASYVEMGIAFVFIGLYMIMFPDQRGGFGELISMVVRDANTEVQVQPVAVTAYSEGASERPARDHPHTGVRDHPHTGVRDHPHKGERDHSHMGERDHSHTGERDHSNTGVRDHSHTGVRDHSLTGERDHSHTGEGEAEPALEHKPKSKKFLGFMPIAPPSVALGISPEDSASTPNAKQRPRLTLSFRKKPVAEGQGKETDGALS